MERNTTEKQKKYTHLTFAEREEISVGLSSGKSVIAEVIVFPISNRCFPVFHF